MNLTFYLAQDAFYHDGDDFVGVFNTHKEAEEYPRAKWSNERVVTEIKLELDNNGNLIKPLIF